MKSIYFTITGMNHYYGSDFLERGMRVKLVKEPENEYDLIQNGEVGIGRLCL